MVSSSLFQPLELKFPPNGTKSSGKWENKFHLVELIAAIKRIW